MGEIVWVKHVSLFAEYRVRENHALGDGFDRMGKTVLVCKLEIMG